MPNNAPPTLLVLEDDPPSRHFLHEALTALPARVDSVETLAQARSAISQKHYDLWLFDARLPDGHSAALLQETHANPVQVAAIALTADPQIATRKALLTAGFIEVLIKPISATDLRRIVRARLLLPTAPASGQQRWNEQHALAAAGGVERTRDALRELFLAELPKVRQQIDVALQTGDLNLLAESLHRLQGSCALVGADALLQAVRALASDPHSAAYRQALQHECKILFA